MLSKLTPLDAMLYANDQDWLDAPVMPDEALIIDDKDLEFKVEYTAFDEALINANLVDLDMPF